MVKKVVRLVVNNHVPCYHGSDHDHGHHGYHDHAGLGCCTEVVCCPDNENFRESASTYLQAYDPPASTWLGTAVCPADLTGDGRVGGEDLPLVLARWGQQVECEAVDLKPDGVVDGQDLAIVLGLWGEDCIGCQADLDDSGMIDGADLTKVLGAWGAGS